MLEVIAAMSALLLNVHSAHENTRDDEARALKAMVYHMYGEAKDPEEPLPESLKAIEAALKTDFHPKDFWNDKEYSFAYGKGRHGEIVIFAWKNDRSVADTTLDVIKERYLDDEFARIQDAKNLESWKQARKDIAGSFIAFRRGDMTVEMPLVAQRQGEAAEKPMEKTPEKVRVESYPTVIFMTPIDLNKPSSKGKLVGSQEPEKLN